MDHIMKYTIGIKNKHQKRIMINDNDPIVQKYNLMHNDIIYYNIYIDRLFDKHLILTNGPVNNKQIIYTHKTKIYKNSLRSKKLMLLFNTFFIDFFKVDNYNYARLKDLNGVNGFLFELLFF